jgi:hypothetical protein
MSNNHIVTRQIGNLRGFSTKSSFMRPSNVAERAINIQRAPDGTLQLRRGYQCQIAAIGGMGIGTFDDPAANRVRTICVGTDGFVYNKLTRQIFLYYDGQITGSITGISNSNPAIVQSSTADLITGAQVILRGVGGMIPINNKTYTITVIDATHFSLNGIDTSNVLLFPPYTSGGIWSIASADGRYLTFSIFTDPLYIFNNAGQSITCNIIVNQAAQVNGNQTLTNTLTVQFGSVLAAPNVIQFISSDGVFQQRNVLSFTSTTVTFDGTPVSVLNGTYINQFFNILFGKGFDVGIPFTIAAFISNITTPITGVNGLQVSINGLSNLPAAFLQIVEPTIIDSNKTFTMDYWYWMQINSTINPPLPGSANLSYQNSREFENATMAAFGDVIFIANGWDYPQKFDGQTVYRAGMPIGIRPRETDNTTFTSRPFSSGNVYQYATTYEQIDSKGNIVEGEISEIDIHTVATTPAAINVSLTNLMSNVGNNWNTDGAVAVGGTATVYGPDGQGFYYDLVNVNPGFTLKIGDTAYYADLTSAVINATSTGIILSVNVGHGVLPGDDAYFFDTSGIEHQRIISSITPTTVTITLGDVSVSAANPNILVYKTGLVFGNVAIVSGNQSDVNTINVLTGHTVELGDVVDFLDSSLNLQRRNVTASNAGSIVIDGVPVSVVSGVLIASEDQRTNAVNIQRLNVNGATLGVSAPISNNLRINIYRTMQGESFGVNGQLFLVASVPNDSSGPGLQTYIDGIPDTELSIAFSNPIEIPNPPPISKYIRSFGNQMVYAGGERGVNENADRVFFSNGNDPETVPLAVNFFNVPNVDDDITGIGVSGSTLITTKNNSLWATTGSFLTGQITVVQISPGSNIGCVAHATISSVSTLMYFLHTNGVYAITENQFFPTDAFGDPIAISLPIEVIFRQTNFLPQTRYVLKRATSINYTKDNQYLLFLPCEDVQTTIRTANINSIILAYDYQEKNWFQWENMNAAGGMVVVDDYLFFQERRFSAVDGNVANLYKQHRFYRLVDHADHAGPQRCEWRSSWEDLQQPEVRKKFCRCILLMNRLSDLLQFNNPMISFSSYLNRIPNLQSTISQITQVDNVRNSSWSNSAWGWNFWAGYQDSFITINLKRGTVAKSIQIGIQIVGINMDIKLAGFQLETIPENRKTVAR